MKRDPIILIVVAMVISIMLVFGIQRVHHSSVPPGKLQGKAAPDFSLPSARFFSQSFSTCTPQSKEARSWWSAMGTDGVR